MQAKPALAVNDHDDLIEDGVTVPPQAPADRAVDLRRALAPGKARQQDTYAHIASVLAGHPASFSLSRPAAPSEPGPAARPVTDRYPPADRPATLPGFRPAQPR